MPCAYDERPNGLAFSGRLEYITLMDRKSLLPRLSAKIAPIQPLRCNAGLSGNRLFFGE
jgi:hypothetical protein